MNPLFLRLRERIRRDGPIAVADYMAAALNDPEHGYYRRRQPLGRSGDFVTAPEISQMFGELVGLWCAEMWTRLGRPDPVLLVELGPGRGTLLADALRAGAKAAPAFRAALRLHPVEANPVLRDEQARVLGAAGAHWHETFDAVPEGPLLVVANEFFDALPIRQFARGAAGWHERRVALDDAGRGLRFDLAPAVTADPSFPEREPGALIEIAPAREDLAASVAGRIVRHGGAALIVDYGAAGTAGDTLQALRRHRPADPLRDPGEADLTSHVDFSALAKAARTAGAAAFGPLPQGIWLNRLGIVARAAQLVAANPAAAASVEAACRRLIAPEEMGTLFKVLAIAESGAGVPPGFDP